MYLRKLKQTISTAWLNQHHHLCKCPGVNTAVVLQLEMVPISQHWSVGSSGTCWPQAYTNRWVCIPELFPKYLNHGMVWDISHPLLEGRRLYLSLIPCSKTELHTDDRVCPPPESRVYLSYKPWMALHEACFSVLTLSLSRIFQTILRKNSIFLSTLHSIIHLE